MSNQDGLIPSEQRFKPQQTEQSEDTDEEDDEELDEDEDAVPPGPSSSTGPIVAGTSATSEQAMTNLLPPSFQVSTSRKTTSTVIRP